MIRGSIAPRTVGKRTPMNNERKTSIVNLNEEKPKNENAASEDKRDKRDWIDREFYTEHGGEG